VKYLLLIFTLSYILFSCKSTPAEPGLTKECPDSLCLVPMDPSLQYIEIPDQHFEKYLIDKGYDSDGLVNGQMKRSDARRVDSIYISSTNVVTAQEYDVIRNTSGIEYFENQLFFSSRNELIDKIDFSHNQKLRSVYIEDYHGSVGGGPGRDKYRALKNINFGKNINLKEIRLLNILLKEVNISGLPNLSKLIAGGYELKTIYINNKKQIKSDWDIVPSYGTTIEYKICEK
jgi:hypothetical protein